MAEQAQSEWLSRREFLAAASLSAAAAVSGCATNPVTGRSQFMLVSETEEINMDRQWAPHQFSNDYGMTQDDRLNAYVSGVGEDLATYTHRPAMPYSFRVVNSTVVNGYTMPGGSIAMCRGLMLAFESEAELAAVLGHELGHVNARHAAEKMSKNLLLTTMVAGVTAYVEQEKKEYAALAAGLGGIGANLLLARYSRDDEREADALGMEYAVRGGHNPRGMVNVMATFQKLQEHRPGAVDLLFATHPMSEERYRTAEERVQTTYAQYAGVDVRRERYMDETARLRAIRGAIEDMQKAETAMIGKRYDEADGLLQSALKQAPDDYAGLLLMAKCRLSQNRVGEAVRYAEKAKSVYPGEPQAEHVLGVARKNLGQYDAALSSFSAYEKMLPGNPNTPFMKALCLDGMGRREQAAAEYMRYRAGDPYGEFSGAAAQRLMEWGYVRPSGQ